MLYYTTTVYAGNYVSTVKAGTSTAYSSGTGSSVSVTHQYNETIYWALASYDTDYSDASTHYYFSGSTSGSFSGGSGTSYTANRSRTTATRYYNVTITAGNYCNTVRAKVGNGSWSSAASSVTVQAPNEATVYYETYSIYGTSTSGFYTYTYSGNSSSLTVLGSDTSASISATRTATHRAPQASDFAFTQESWDNGDDDDTMYQNRAYVKNNYDKTVSMRVFMYSGYNATGTCFYTESGYSSVGSGSTKTSTSSYIYYEGISSIKLFVVYNSTTYEFNMKNIK